MSEANARVTLLGDAGNFDAVLAQLSKGEHVMTDPIDEIPGIPARYRKSIAAFIAGVVGLAALLLTDGYVSGTARHVTLIVIAVGTFLITAPGATALAKKNAEKAGLAKHSLAKRADDLEARLAVLEARPEPTDVMRWGIDYARVHFGQASSITIGPEE